MVDRRKIGIAEFQVARAPAVLVSYGLGSCLGIALYQPEQRLGGLAHSLLPGPPATGREHRPEKFVAGAIWRMLDELLSLGATTAGLTAKLAGGATMFDTLAGSGEPGIGARNIAAARRTLAELGIALVAEEVGGSQGRTIEFDLTTGLLRVRSLRHGERII